MADTTHNNRGQSAGLLGIHAMTSLHPGSGTALGTVDLPVQRERHTQWPTIAGSALKGVLRDALRERVRQQKQLEDEPEVNSGKKQRTARDQANEDRDIVQIFGPPTASSSESAGAVSVTDARILAFPVRSLKGVFAWVTCPAVLDRLERDAALANEVVSFPIPPIGPDRCITHKQCLCRVNDQMVILEEFEFTPEEKGDISPAADWIATHLLPADAAFNATRERMKRQLILLHDDDFTHFVRYATEVNARIGLDYETKTVKNGALFYQEFLPTETVLYSVVMMNASRAKQGNTAVELMETLQGYMPGILQIGGDETTGKGYCGVRLKVSTTGS